MARANRYRQQISYDEMDTFSDPNPIHDDDTMIISLSPVPTRREDERIDTNALNGLRGIVAIHIMLHHSFEFSKLQQNLLGSVQMPLFFLISGFILALNDGKHHYALTKCCTELQRHSAYAINDTAPNRFNAKHFYQRRIARTIPLHYLTSFAAIPLVYAGYSTFVSPGIFLYITAAFTIFAVGSWFGPFFLNPPAWFVSTIWFFYWLFPRLLPKLQRYTNQAKQSWIVYHYFLQLVIGAIVYIACRFVPNVSGFAFNIATMWPPTRLPLFIMGILAGLLRNEGSAIRQCQTEWTVRDWKRKCNYLGVSLFAVLIPCVIADRWSDNKTNCSLSLQLLIAWWQLQFIYALTMDDGTSWMSRALCWKWMVALGRVSYSIYLVHFPAMRYICWCVYGAQRMPLCEWNSDEDCNGEWEQYNDQRLLPVWCIPIHVCVSVVVAIILNRVVEEPMRRCLRPRN